MDDDRDEIIHGDIEDLVDNADWKDHGEQDFDPDMEMEEELDRMRELAGIETDESWLNCRIYITKICSKAKLCKLEKK